MEQKTNSRDIFIKEMPGLSAEPAALGLFGLAVGALVLGVTDIGLASSSAKSLMLPWVLFFGATAQIIAGMMDFKRNNIFGATVFSTFAMAWYAVGLTLIISIFTGVQVDTRHYGYGLLGILIFSLIATFASIMTNKLLFITLIMVDGALAGLVAHYLFGTSEFIVGIFLLLTALFSFYGAAAVLVNSMAGKTVFPMGKPLWKP